ncbi:hypothetical protein NSERUTF1_4898 [Nocardia seriolae]|nr:hypothetical protein NSERUTF1_4898 [Nocardia seriolae]
MFFASHPVELGHQCGLAGLQCSYFRVDRAQLFDHREGSEGLISDFTHTIDHSFESFDTTA